MKYLVAELVYKLHQYVACNCNHHLRTASTHWSTPRNCISEQVRSRGSDAACDHSPWLRVPLGLSLVQLPTHTHHHHPLPPVIQAVHSASCRVGRTIDPAEVMVSKREAVSMSALPSSTMEGP